ncbi:hypothetical protein ACLD9W_12270, partial [Neisseria sp. WLZKY-1]|uniref:hypothetical protein n=1 Tax=Neisseria sp. WLZKY-1 TaxID=3390377 RepID=UPI00397C9D74
RNQNSKANNNPHRSARNHRVWLPCPTGWGNTVATACGLRVLRRTRLPSFKGRLKAGLRASAPFPPMRDNVSESSVSAKAKRYNQTASNGKNACAAEPYPTTYGLRLLTGGEFDPAGIAGRQAIF